MRQLYVNKLQPLQFSLHICGNIESKSSFVNHDEIPLPSGSGHSEPSETHFAAAGVLADVVVGEGAGVGAGGDKETDGVEVVVCDGDAVIGAEQRAYILAPAPPPCMRRRPGLLPMDFLQIDPDGANSVVPPHTELVQAE